MEKLSKAGLCYNSTTNAIENGIRDWMVAPPINGFIFPAFNDRDTDIHSVLLYDKDGKNMPYGLIDGVLGCTVPMSAKSQKETFQNIVKETLGDKCDFEAVKLIHESLNDLLEETRDDPVQPVLNMSQFKDLLENNGADLEELQEFESRYVDVPGPSLTVANVVNTKSFEIKTPEATIHVDPNRTSILESRVIEGKPYLMIAINDHMEVNGISVKPVSLKDRKNG